MNVTGFYLSAPSVVKVNEVFDLKIKVLTTPYKVSWTCRSDTPPYVEDRFNLSPRGINYMDNVIRKWTGQVTLEGNEGYEGPSVFSFKEVTGPCKNDDRAITQIGHIRFSCPGIKFTT